MLFKKITHKLLPLLSIGMVLTLLLSLPVHAVDYQREAEERKSLPIESNAYDNWPLGPAIGAQSAILMDANTGAILYEKNIHEKLYPASITKLLTTYIALQQCELDEMVTFSEEAVHSINWRTDANMGINAGSSITMEEALYGILVGSANEAAYAVAEHISGNLEDFAKLMNKTAKELGCKNSHFVTPNGIHDDNHYTTAYDMALIAKAFFENETLSKISGTTRHEVAVTPTQTRENIVLNAKSQLLPGKPYAYEPLIGTKTGYTDYSRQTLVSCAKKNGLKLICVILKEESPAQFTDTIELFEYGFQNFDALYLNDMDTPYTIDHSFFSNDIDILGSSKPILALNNEDYIVLPNTIDFNSLSSRVLYEENNQNRIATIQYDYKNHILGNIGVELASEEPYVFDFSTQKHRLEDTNVSDNVKIIYINVFHVLIGFLILTLSLSCLIGLRSLFSRKRRARKKSKRLHRSLNVGRYWDIYKF